MGKNINKIITLFMFGLMINQAPAVGCSDRITPYLEIGSAKFFNESIGWGSQVDGFIPLWQKDLAQLIFLQTNCRTAFGRQLGGSFNLGTRLLYADGGGLVGVHGGYDYLRSRRGHNFNQLTFGVENWLFGFFSKANLYLPVGKHRYQTNFTDHRFSFNFNDREKLEINSRDDLSQDFFINRLVPFREHEEEGIFCGMDVGVGYELFPGLTATVGGYAEIGKKPEFQTQVNYQITLSNRRIFGLFDHITCEAGVGLRGARTAGYVGLSLRINCVQGVTLNGMSRHLNDKIASRNVSYSRYVVREEVPYEEIRFAPLDESGRCIDISGNIWEPNDVDTVGRIRKYFSQAFCEVNRHAATAVNNSIGTSASTALVLYRGDSAVPRGDESTSLVAAEMDNVDCCNRFLYYPYGRCLPWEDGCLSNIYQRRGEESQSHNVVEDPERTGLYSSGVNVSTVEPKLGSNSYSGTQLQRDVLKNVKTATKAGVTNSSTALVLYRGDSAVPIGEERIHLVAVEMDNVDYQRSEPLRQDESKSKKNFMKNVKTAEKAGVTKFVAEVVCDGQPVLVSGTCKGIVSYVTKIGLNRDESNLSWFNFKLSWFNLSWFNFKSMGLSVFNCVGAEGIKKVIRPPAFGWFNRVGVNFGSKLLVEMLKLGSSDLADLYDSGKITSWKDGWVPKFNASFHDSVPGIFTDAAVGTCFDEFVVGVQTLIREPPNEPNGLNPGTVGDPEVPNQVELLPKVFSRLKERVLKSVSKGASKFVSVLSGRQFAMHNEFVSYLNIIAGLVCSVYGVIAGVRLLAGGNGVMAILVGLAGIAAFGFVAFTCVVHLLVQAYIHLLVQADIHPA